MLMENGVTLIFFMAWEYSTVCTHHILFLHSSVNGRLGGFPVLAIVNSGAVNAGGARILSNKQLYSHKVAQSCSALFDPMSYTVHGILQATILEWVAMTFSE